MHCSKCGETEERGGSYRGEEGEQASEARASERSINGASWSKGHPLGALLSCHTYFLCLAVNLLIRLLKKMICTKINGALEA